MACSVGCCSSRPGRRLTSPEEKSHATREAYAQDGGSYSETLANEVGPDLGAIVGGATGGALAAGLCVYTGVGALLATGCYGAGSVAGSLLGRTFLWTEFVGPYFDDDPNTCRAVGLSCHVDKMFRELSFGF
jgi:hypothetical protein